MGQQKKTQKVIVTNKYQQFIQRKTKNKWNGKVFKYLIIALLIYLHRKIQKYISSYVVKNTL